MQHNYQIIDLSPSGLPFVEVHGKTFSYKDLYELVGHQQFMTTFILKENTEAQAKFGETITGVIYYDHKSLLNLQKSSISNDDINLKIIKINSPATDLSVEQLSDLKYGGIKISDIESISFISWKKETQTYETGEKKVPNIIEIEADLAGIDPDLLSLNYLISKNNNDVELFDYEKEQLIGIILAIRDRTIDSRILKSFGFSVESVKTNMNVWYHFYKVKERRNILSDDEKKKLSELEDILGMDKIIRFLKEIEKSGVNEQEIKAAANALKEILDSIRSFSPSILLHGKKQIYWDIDSYIHIVMRHIKDYQFGSFKEKTPLPYKIKDLKNLIEGVLKCIGDEYQLHHSTKPNSNFTRVGSMAIVFNGDHYHLTIDSKGRLLQFHTKPVI